MDPKLVSMNNYDDTLEFTLEEIELSFANAIRRTILSDIPVVCFKTYPEKENQCTILINTTKHNNEIVKQRLSCIPIHITDDDFPLDGFCDVRFDRKQRSLLGTDVPKQLHCSASGKVFCSKCAAFSLRLPHLSADPDAPSPMVVVRGWRRGGRCERQRCDAC